jgi:hypothetical protein
MGIVKAAVGMALAATAVLGGSGTAVADTPASATGGNYIVTAWHDVNLRSCFATSCSIEGRLRAGDSRIAYCYEYGETISDLGITNDVWIAVNGAAANEVLYVSAVYLQGDQYAKLPFATAYCSD